jgi:hypothetical protein
MKQEISGILRTRAAPRSSDPLPGKEDGQALSDNGSETGNIYFSEGEVVHAQCAALTGIKAIHEIAVWTSGEYRFFVDEPADMQTVIMGIEEVLSETTNHLRQMDKRTSLIPSRPPSMPWSPTSGRKRSRSSPSSGRSFQRWTAGNPLQTSPRP